VTELQVLHIIPRWSHGGAASAVVLEARHAHASGSGIRHRALTLERGGSSVLVKEALGARLRLHIAPSPAEEANLVHSAHAVVVHFWNTPSVRCFLDRWRGKALRWMLSAHVNGLHRPQRLPPRLAASACHVVLANAQALGIVAAENASVIPAVADLGEPRTPGDSFRSTSIGHAGTLNVFKLSPHFVPLHVPVAEASDPVLVIGSGGDEDRFRAEAAALGVAEGFRWLGFRFDLREQFARIRSPRSPMRRPTRLSRSVRQRAWLCLFSAMPRSRIWCATA
jgi:hypothetical protein